MSALAIVFQRDGSPYLSTMLRAMLDSASYRGPDMSAVRTWPNGIGLGFGQLSVTHEDADGEQPLVSPRTGSGIVADARLDNRSELLNLLPGHLDWSTSDAELILRAYEHWGSAMPARLLGDFALAIWDPRRQQLLLARDTSGQRTLFYRDDGRLFVAASELHQLLQDPSVPVEPNEERIRDFLVPLNALRNLKEQHETFYRGMYAVPAGHTLLVTRRGVSSSAFWDMSPSTEVRYRKDSEYADHFQALFFTAVEARLRSNGRVGSLLSGGLDSSSIVCTAQELYRCGRASDRGFLTFSTVFDAPDRDERHLIESTRAKYDLTTCFVPPGDFAGQLQLAPRYFAEGPHMSADRRADPLMQAITAQGVRVLLTGDIADAYVGGSRLVFDSLLRQGRLRSFWNHFRTYRRLQPREPLRDTLVESCVAPLLPMAAQRRVMTARVEQVLLSNWAAVGPNWIGKKVREDIRRRHLQLCLGIERTRRFASPAREAQYRALYPPLLSPSVPGWSVELRRPFADRRLHEFMLAVPPEQHFQPHPEVDLFYAGSKRLLRSAMRGVLPEPVRLRTTKTAFGGIYVDDVRQRWPQYEAAFGPSATPIVAERGYVDRRQFWSRLEQLREGAVGADFIYILHIVGLESWLRGFNQPRHQLVTVPVASADSSVIEPARERR